MPKFESERRQRNISNVAPAGASLAELVEVGMEFCSGFFGEVLQLAKQVLVRFPFAVDKQSFGVGALAAFSDGTGEPLGDFDRAGLA